MQNYTLNSREAAEMVDKKHTDLLRDIRRYVGQLAESNIALGAFFEESTYLDANNQSRPCHLATNEERKCILQSKSAYAIIPIGKKL